MRFFGLGSRPHSNALLTALFGALGAAPASARAANQKPRVGECRNITYDQFLATSNSTTPVACSESHTAQTYLVGTVSKRLLEGPRRKLGQAIDAKCNPAWAKAVGRSTWQRLQSAYWGGFWTPNKAQRQQGAR